MKFEEIQKITWGIADVIRDEGSGETTDYMKIGLPLIFLKRVLDIRKEYVDTYLKTTRIYKLNKDLLETLDVEGNKMKIYLTDLPEWYFISWEDIRNYKKNDNMEDREIKLSNHPSLTINTKAQNIQSFIEEVINSFTHPKIVEIFNESEFLNRIKNPKAISSSTFMKLIALLGNEDFSFKNAPTDIFSDAYMDLIEKFAEGAGKKGGEFFTPKSLCEGVVSLLDPEMPEKGTLKVCDITSGSSTFITVFLDYLRDSLVSEKEITLGAAIEEVDKRVHVYIQEKTAFTLIMGEMNLLLMGMSKVEGFIANSITEYVENIGKYRNQMDYFVGNPPYGLKDYGVESLQTGKGAKAVITKIGEEPRWELGIPPKGEGEFAFMNTFMDMLHVNGRGALILPLGTLFKDSTKFIRKEYVENDWIEGLVLLPDSMFTTTGIPVVVWFFNKNKDAKDKDKIFMINASETFIKEGKFKVWEKDIAKDVYSDRRPTEDYADYISLDTIRENDYNLSVQRYVFKEVPEEVFDVEELISDGVEVETDISEKKVVLDDIFAQINGLRG